MICLLFALFLTPASAAAESLTEGVAQIIGEMDVSALQSVLDSADPFAATGGFLTTLTAIAKGDMTVDFD